MNRIENRVESDNNRKIFKLKSCQKRKSKSNNIWLPTLTFGSNLWSMILSKKDQQILLLMLSNGSPTISVIFLLIKITEKFKPMDLTVKTTLRKFLLMSPNFRKRNSKAKPEAEWESLKKSLVLLIKRKSLNLKSSLRPFKLNYSFKAS